MTGNRVPISGLSDEQVANIEEQYESSNASNRSEYLRALVDKMEDDRLRSIDEDPLAAIEELLDGVAPPQEAAEYDPADGVRGTLDREMVYDIIDYYETPAIRPDDVEHDSLPGNMTPKIEALAAVARWRCRDRPIKDYAQTAEATIKAAIRHPSSHVIDEYRPKLVSELKQTGTAADNTMDALPTVDDWIARSEAVLNGLEMEVDGGRESDTPWDEFRSRAEKTIADGETMLANLIDDGECDRVSKRLAELRKALEEADEAVARRRGEEKMEEMERAK